MSFATLRIYEPSFVHILTIHDLAIAKQVDKDNNIHTRQLDKRTLNYLDIVPFVTTPLKGRFVVFLQWLLIVY